MQTSEFLQPAPQNIRAACGYLLTLEAVFDNVLSQSTDSVGRKFGFENSELMDKGDQFPGITAHW